MPTLTLGGHVYVLSDNRNYFIDPLTTTAYAWRVNHRPDGDKGIERKRPIEATSNAGNVGTVRQQGADEPLLLRREGDIIDATQEQEMWKWTQLSKGQTIYFVEFNGDAYEVQITDYKPERQGILAGLGPERNYLVKYSIEMEVYAVLAGVLYAAGVAP